MIVEQWKENKRKKKGENLAVTVFSFPLVYILLTEDISFFFNLIEMFALCVFPNLFIFRFFEI